jgi:hypothetical protein
MDCEIKPRKPSVFRRSLKVHGVPIDTEFTFFEGHPSTEFEPECPDELWLDAVFVDGIDIINLCGDGTIAEIEMKLWKLLDNKEE